MSGDEQDKAIGNMVRRYGDAKKALAAIRGEASRLADGLSRLSGVLSHSPQYVTVEGDIIDLRFPRGIHRENPNPVPVADLDTETIGRIADDARKALKTIEELEPQLKQLGVLNSK